jgi:excisionase family DNA binding protein
MNQESYGRGRSERVAFSIDEIAHQYGVSTSSVRRAIARGELEAVKFGGLTRVLEADPRKFPPARLGGKAA